MDNNAYNELVVRTRKYLDDGLLEAERHHNAEACISRFRTDNSHLFALVVAWEEMQTSNQIEVALTENFGLASLEERVAINAQIVELLPHMPLRAAVNFILDVRKTATERKRK